MKLDRTKHKATEETYEFAFDLMHDIGEKMESVGKPINKDDSAHEMIESLYEKVESMKENLSKEISKEKNL
jgi:DNA-binding ferritin-like protein